MDQIINLDAVYDKNLNFLIGSGASFGLFPTLALGIRDANDVPQTIETLSTSLPDGDPRQTALFMHYYKECIFPAQALSRAAITGNAGKEAVLRNYRTFVETLLQILLRRRPLDKRCNVFTTNYDTCFPLVADELLRSGTIDFVLNDGSRGFMERPLQARNFNTYLCQTGIFERDQSSIPQLNLIHLHGSVHWRKLGSGIAVEYKALEGQGLLTPELVERLHPFSAQLANQDARIEDLVAPQFEDNEEADFWAAYRLLPIVNPTKWKFHETVFEEHYYQMLRLLSYELEKPNAILITFGFSFADEHILNLIKRSLANPRLQVFVCCFTAAEAERLRPEFEIYPNVRFVGLAEGRLDFSAFNSKILNVRAAAEAQQTAVAPAEEGAQQ